MKRRKVVSEDFNKEVGERLKRFRETVGITQMGLAYLVGMNRATIANAEAGRYSLSALEAVRLATWLGISVRTLLLGKGKRLGHI